MKKRIFLGHPNNKKKVLNVTNKRFGMLESQCGACRMQSNNLSII